MSATMTPPRDPADPEVQAALRRLSAGVIRSLRCIEESRKRRAAAEMLPDELPTKEVAGAPPQSAGRVSSTTTTVAQRSSQGDGHAS